MAGEFENISTEIKNTYPTGTFDEMVNREAPYRGKLKKSPPNLRMSEGIVKFPIWLNPMNNRSIIGDNVAFPTPKDPTRQQGQITPEIFAGSLQIGFKTKAAAKSQKSTFYDQGTLGDRIENCAKDVAKMISRVYSGTNRGRIGIVGATQTTNNLITLALPLGVELLTENDVIDEYTALNSGSIRGSISSRTITAIDYDNKIATYSGATDTSTVGDSIFYAGAQARTPIGLPDIVDDGTIAGTIFGLSRTTFPKLKATVLAAAGVFRNLTEQLILDAIDRPRRRVGKKINMCWSNSGQSRKYVEFVAADRRYPGATEGKPSYVVGYADDSLQIVAPGVNVTCEINYDIQPRAMFFLSWDTFGHYEAQPLDWADQDTMLKLTPGSGVHNSSYLAYLCSIENQYNLMPLANTRLDDLKDPICGDV